MEEQTEIAKALQPEPAPNRQGTSLINWPVAGTLFTLGLIIAEGNFLEWFLDQSILAQIFMVLVYGFGGWIGMIGYLVGEMFYG